MRLASHEVTSTGLVLLEYQTTGAAPLADYAGVHQSIHGAEDDPATITKIVDDALRAGVSCSY